MNLAAMPNLSLDQRPSPLVQGQDVIMLRLLTHRLSAGFPSPATDYSDEGLDLNDYLVRNKPATFMFTVRGDSMIGAAIEDGDKVVVDRALTAKNRDIVVAAVDGEYTIKRLYKYRGKVELRPENPNYPAITFGDGTELQIWGVVVGVVRRYTSKSS
jgi:DNA polymerase V